MKKFVGLLGLSLIFFVHFSSAQTPEECSKFEYRDYNKMTPEVQNVKTITGTVKIEDDKNTRLSSCLGVYEEKTKKLVRIVYLQLKQKFDLREIPDGEYRVVVYEKDGFFCPVNITVKVDQSIVEKAAIAIKLKRPSADTCSYGDLKT
jgi:hypothetical protein